MMKRTIFAILFCVASAYAEPRFEIIARLIEAPESLKIPADIETIRDQVEFLTAPKVTVTSGQKTDISVTREFKIEGQGSVPIGLELEIEVLEQKNAISFTAKYKLTEFIGFTDEEGARSPRFSTVTIPFSGEVTSGTPYLFPVGPKRSGPQQWLHMTITESNQTIQPTR
jgi:hypothetical protein